MTIEVALIAAVCACAGAITHLYLRQENLHEKALAASTEDSRLNRVRLDKCDEDRKDLRKEIERLKRGCSLPNCPLREFERLE
jgi:hypothetical protein